MSNWTTTFLNNRHSSMLAGVYAAQVTDEELNDWHREMFSLAEYTTNLIARANFDMTVSECDVSGVEEDACALADSRLALFDRAEEWYKRLLERRKEAGEPDAASAVIEEYRVGVESKGGDCDE